MRKIYLLALVAMLAGCATEYQRADSFGYGFYDTQLAENVFEVSFQGSDADGVHRMRDLAMLRASEITLEHGFRYFKILAEDDQAEHGTVVTGGYGVPWYNAVTNTTESYEVPVTSASYTEHGSTKRIMCFKDKPEGAVVYDAEFVSNSIRESYGINP